MSRTLKHYKRFKGTLTCLTGLRIGGSKETIDIGGAENTIIRHPISDLPYIPGSSIKGKMRSLLEQKYGIVEDNGEPSHSGTHIVCRVFGPHMNLNHNLGPTRILVRDANLTDDSKKVLEDAQKEKGVFFAEIKSENIINRNTGVAANKGLRTQERVPAETKFEFEISVRIFGGYKDPVSGQEKDPDNETEIINLIKEGLDLLQQDYLGSSGSRGYGKVNLEYSVA